MASIPELDLDLTLIKLPPSRKEQLQNEKKRLGDLLKAQDSLKSDLIARKKSVIEAKADLAALKCPKTGLYAEKRRLKSSMDEERRELSAKTVKALVMGIELSVSLVAGLWPEGVVGSDKEIISKVKTAANEHLSRKSDVPTAMDHIMSLIPMPTTLD